MNLAKFIQCRRTPKKLILEKIKIIKDLRENQRMKFKEIAGCFYSSPAGIKTLFYRFGGRKKIKTKSNINKILNLICLNCQVQYKSNIIFKCPDCFSENVKEIYEN